MFTETDVFKVRKSSYSRRLAKQTDGRKKKRDVKKETNGVNNTIVDENKIKTENQNKDDLNVIWIKSEEIKENKTQPKEELKIFAGDQIESDDEYENEAEEYRNNEPFHHFRGALERGVIPDAKTIFELKKQRQLARDIDELIIPLADDDNYDDLSDSRMIRDDDNDKSDDDEDDQRISFAINRDNIEREKAREAFLIAQEENEDQSDREEDESEDELDRWEREQIKKGVRMPVIHMLSQEQASNRAISGLFVDNLNIVDMDIDRPFAKPKKSIPSRILNKNKYSITLEEVVKRVEQHLQSLKDSIAANERQVVTLTANLNQSKQEIERLSIKRNELIVKSEIKTEPDQ